MAKTKAEVDGRVVVLTDEENPLMRLRVRRKGDGKISTGTHDTKGGDILFEEGEEFVVRKDVADALIERDLVDEIKGDLNQEPIPSVTGEEPEAAPVIKRRRKAEAA